MRVLVKAVGRMIGITAACTMSLCAIVSAENPIGPSFDALNKFVKPNYEAHQPGTSNPGRDVMICIMPDNFAPAFQAYAAWKHKSGTFIKIVKFSDIGAENTPASCSTSIKPYIEKAFKTWKYRPSHVLLVGDAGVFPLAKYSSETEGTYQANNVTDEFFGEFDSSNRYQPDVMVGRLPVKDTAQMVNMLKKLMNYERTPVMDDPAWFKRIVAISSNQKASGTGLPTFQVEVVRAVSLMQMEHGFSVDTLMCDDDFQGGLDTVLKSINKGCTFINYRGQGWAQGWLTPCYQFYIPDVPRVKNAGMMPFITGIGCGISQFDVAPGGIAGTVSECFGEEMLRLGTPAAPRGAIAILAPTGETHTYWNNAMDSSLYIGMFKNNLWSTGHALSAAIYGMYKGDLNQDTSDYLTRLYLILGDPSTRVWQNVPKAVTITGPTKIPLGESSQTFTVKIGTQPVKNAEVCISGDLTDSVTYVTGFTDSTGTVNLSIDASSDEMLSLVVVGDGILPLEQQIMAGNVAVNWKQVNAASGFSLTTNFPNHSVPTASISYTLPKAGYTTLEIYSLHGSLIRTVTSGMQSSGSHSISWNGRDNAGIATAKGVYVISLRQANNVIRQRVTKID